MKVVITDVKSLSAYKKMSRFLCKDNFPTELTLKFPNKNNEDNIAYCF